MDPMADVCDGFYRIFVRNPLPDRTASDQTAQPLYIWIPCDGVHLWRNHESGGPLYERVRFYMGRTACNLYFRYSGGSCSCQFYIYLSVDWSKAIVGKAVADKNKI